MTNKAGGDSIAIPGTQDTTAGNQAVMAVDTSVSGGSLYWYFQPSSPALGQFAISTDSYGNPLVWFTDNSYGTYAIGAEGQLNGKR
jgi:hypothetical protein